MVVDRRRSVGLAVLVAAVLVAWSVVPHGVLAASPAAPAVDPLAGPFVDVVTIPPTVLGLSKADAPGLLVVEPPDPAAPSLVHLRVIAASATGWASIHALTLATGFPAAGPAELVALDPDAGGPRVAVVTSDATAARTYVGIVSVTLEGLVPGPADVVGAGPVAVGLADVVGDDRPELVLAGPPRDAADQGQTVACPETQLDLLDTATLGRVGGAAVHGAALLGGVVGRFSADGRESLVAYASAKCGASTSDRPDMLLAVDLATGRALALPADAASPPREQSASPIPLVADLDRDGIDEAIARSGSSTVVLDPTRHWAPETIDPAGLPVAVVDAHGRPRLVVDQVGLGTATPRLTMSAIGRARVGGPLVRQGLTAVITGPSDSSGGSPGIELATNAAAPPPVWEGDLDGNGCQVLLVPGGSFVRCPSDSVDWTSREGPSWIQTVPLAVLPGPFDRQLLVAAGVGWATTGSGLAVPSPAASSLVAANRWRSGPSAPFRLETVSTAVLDEEPSSIPDPPTIAWPEPDRTVVQAGAGGRVFVRFALPATDAGPAAQSPDASPSFGEWSTTVGAAFLTSRPLDDSWAVVGMPRIQGPEPGRVDLAPPAGEVGRRLVRALTIDAMGDVSPIATIDLRVAGVGLPLAIAPPALSPPWPFTATIDGRAAPGTRVRLAGGSFQTVGPDGRFAVEAQLAPWPQVLDLEAVDPNGRETSQQVSVVGGFDYRQLPWQPLVILVVLAGVALTTFGRPALRTGRRSVVAPGPSYPRTADPSDGSESGRAEMPWTEGRRGSPVDDLGEIEDLPSPR